MSFFFILISTECNKDDVTENKETILAENATYIDDNTWQESIVSVDSSKFSYVFNNNIAELDLETGDVIVSSVGNGMLRKVDSLKTVGSNIEIKTSEARLTDLFEQAEVNFTDSIDLSQIHSIRYHVDGITFDTSALKNTKETQFKWNVDHVLYDLDGNNNTTNDQVRLIGDFAFDSEIIFDLDIGFFKLKKLEIGFQASNEMNLELNAKLNYHFQKEISLFTVYFNPFKLPAGPVTLVITPVFSINAGIDGTSNASMTVSVQENFNYKVGVIYEDGSGWDAYQEKSLSFGYQPPDVTLSATAKAYLEPEFLCLVYGVIGPYVNVNLYGKITVSPLDDPWWDLSCGHDLGIGVKAKIFGYEIFDYFAPNIIMGEQQIAQSPNIGSLPVVTTDTVSGITETNATCGGNVTSEGNSAVTARGVCWGTSQNPTISGNHTEDGAGSGHFTSSLTGLTKDTQYYIRAYARNSAGINYGNPVLFKTKGGPGGEPCPGITTVNYQGKTYNTVQIGEQCWLKENLDVGTRLTWQDQSNNGIIEKYCYNDEELNCEIYGGLYSWKELMNYTILEGAQGICPSGWHIPTNHEFYELIFYLGNNYDTITSEFYAGRKLKEAGTLHWLPPNDTCATNESGFTALPGGHGGLLFFDLGTGASFVSSSIYIWDTDTLAYGLSLTHNYGVAFIFPHHTMDIESNNSGNSVRCIKDN